MRRTLYSIFLVIVSYSLSYSLIYRVQENDSLWALSKKYNVSSDTIILLNELYKEHLYKDQKLFIPDTIVDYTVQAGDNLSAISQTFQTEVKYIIILNNLATEQLFIGQNIKIPACKNKKNPSKPKIVYTVKNGDNLSRIAFNYKVSLDDIKKWNNKNNDDLIIGEKIIIFSAANVSEESNTQIKKMFYTVQSGDNLETIAKHHDMTLDEIKQWNSKKNDTILIGERLSVKQVLPKRDTNKSSSIKVIDHKVLSGDHLSGLAQKYHVSINDIKEWNKLKRDHLYVDETLTIKTSVDTQKQYDPKSNKKKWYYTVKKGDNLSEIAKRYDTTVDELMRWNSKEKKIIYTGERLALYSNKNYKEHKSQTVVADNQNKIKVKWTEIKHHPVNQSRIKYLSQTDKGIILHLSKRTGVRCIADGRVEYAGFLKTKNYVVIINYGQNKRMVYGYMSQITVNAGDTIKAGDYIGVADYLSIHQSTPLLLELYEGKSSIDIFSIYPYLRKVRFTAFK